MDRFALDIAHLFAGGLVLVSFMLLYQDRMFSLINTFALHAFVVSVSVAWQAHIQNAPHLYITHDGGKTWSVQLLQTTAEVKLDSSNASISQPQFFSQVEGILAVTKFSAGSAQQASSLQGTYVYSTADGGAHWSDPQPLALPGGVTFVRTLAVVDASHWFLLSDSAGIARTTDGGRHWTALAAWLPANEHVTAIEFQNADTGWAEVVVAGPHPTLAIYRTGDGGAHWTRFSVPDIAG